MGLPVMTVVLCCPCRNISLHLDRAPSAQETPFWLSECFKLPQGVGKATLSTVAATTKQVETLCAQRAIERDAHQWNCLICLNCETFVYAERSTGGSPLYINMVLQTKPDKDLGSQRMLSSFYSPVWKIILKDEEEQSSSVLEPPDVSDAERYALFKQLQQDMQEYLKEEEKAMHQRIREYEQKQLEEHRELHTRAYRDRKVLWRRIDEELAKAKDDNTTSPVPLSGPASSPALLPTESPIEQAVVETEVSEPQETQTPAIKIQAPSGNTWKDSRITERKEQGDWLFQFDDELDQGAGPSHDDEPLDDPEDYDINSDDEQTPIREEAPVHSSYQEYQMAASLPVVIPTRFGAASRESLRESRGSPPIHSTNQLQREHVAGSHRRPLQGEFEIPAAQGHADQEILSKSFVIPRSRNRVKAWM